MSSRQTPEPTHPVAEPMGDLPVDKAFARHETFHPRYGWLKKGFDHAAATPDIFLRDDATVRLGVGKNMVRAIRYWCRATKIIEEFPGERGPRVLHARPTEFGIRLLGDGGWDPYLEHPASYWLLHWQLLSPVCVAPSWWIAFNAFRSTDFTDQELASAIESFCLDRTGWADVARGSFKKDVDCILHMYGGSSGHEILEDTIDSPFAQLDLLRATSGEKRHYSFRLGAKDTLPSALVLWSSLEYIRSRFGDGQHAISLSHLTYDEGSPGRVFRLPETSMRSSLEEAISGKGARLTDLAGVLQLRVEERPSALAATVLDGLYAKLDTRQG